MTTKDGARGMDLPIDEATQVHTGGQCENATFLDVIRLPLNLRRAIV